VTAAQLACLAYSSDEVRLLVATERLIRVRHGVYRLCGVEPDWRSMALAAVLAAGEATVLSHRSAGVLWGLLDQHHEAGPLELIVPRRCRLEGVHAHRNRLPTAEMTRRLAIPVTTAERTLLDLAQSTPGPELGRLCDEALRRRVAALPRLRALVEAHRGGGRRRLEPIRAVLADRMPGYDPGANDWEQRMDRLWDQLGLPPAERQYRVRVGRRTYRLDRAIVALRIAVEWNGFDPHGFRHQFDRDSDRRAELASAGWLCLDFTTRSRPDVICRAVQAVVAERRLLLGQAS
jgi:hypothetical protein